MFTRRKRSIVGVIIPKWLEDVLKMGDTQSGWTTMEHPSIYKGWFFSVPRFRKPPFKHSETTMFYSVSRIISSACKGYLAFICFLVLLLWLFCITCHLPYLSCNQSKSCSKPNLHLARGFSTTFRSCEGVLLLLQEGRWSADHFDQPQWASPVRMLSRFRAQRELLWRFYSFFAWHLARHSLSLASSIISTYHESMAGPLLDSLLSQMNNIYVPATCRL